MRALTLSQPWATLHVAPCSLTNNEPPKRFESRGWRLILRPSGSDNFETIAIHAGKSIPRDMRAAVSDGEMFREPFAKLLQGCGYSALDPWRGDYWDKIGSLYAGGPWYSTIEGAYLKPLILGAVIGTVKYIDVVPGIYVRNLVDRGQLPAHELELGNYDGVDRWGFRSGHAVHFENGGVECRGYQQVWRLSEPLSKIVHDRSVGLPVR